MATVSNTYLRFGREMNYSTGPLEWAHSWSGSLPADGSSITHDAGAANTYLRNYEGPRFIAQIVAPFDMRLVGMSYAMDISNSNVSQTGFTVACMKTSFNDMNDKDGEATWTAIGRVSSSISGSADRAERGATGLYSTDGYGKVSAGDAVGWVLTSSGASMGSTWGILTSIFEGQG